MAGIETAARRWVLLPVLVAAISLTALAFATFESPGLIPGREFPLFFVDLVPVALGCLVALRAPSAPVGPALAWMGAAIIGTEAVETWGETYSTAAGWWGSEVVAVIGRGFWPWQLMGFVWLMLVFPSGLLPGRRWRCVAGAAPVAAVLINLGLTAPAGTPADQPVTSWHLVLVLTGLPLLLGSLLGAVLSLVVRCRRGDERTRLQLRWVILAGGSVPILLAVSWWLVGAGVPGSIAYSGFILGMLILVPAAVTVAILRYDLFDIDRLISESLAWLLTSVVSAGIFAAVVLVVGETIGDASRFGITGAAFVTALCLLPIHQRLNGVVGQVLDRERTVVLARVARFVELVRDGQAEPELVEDVLREAVRDPKLRLLLAVPGHDDRFVTLQGEPLTPPDHARQVPLRTRDSDVGILVLGASSPRLFRRAREAAMAARLPIEVSRLRLELRAALADVVASRSRLTLASAGESRRLERDLHDGAQQRIVAVGMQLRAVQRQLTPADATYGELDEAIAAIEGTIAELRRLAHGIRPSQLDDGLASALQILRQNSAIPIELSIDDLDLPEIVATTAYFVITEAVANALKHSRAERILVSVRSEGTHVSIHVCDDGAGGANDGFGLISMRDRVASVGGELSTHSPVGRGTDITAVIPCGS